jgi:hypothetical protein
LEELNARDDSPPATLGSDGWAGLFGSASVRLDHLELRDSYALHSEDERYRWWREHSDMHVTGWLGVGAGLKILGWINRAGSRQTGFSGRAACSKRSS